MHHFLFEFITGGGLSDQDLPDSLAYEGDLMLRALLNDLVDAGHTNISLTRDSRLAPLTGSITQHIVNKDVKERLAEIIKQDDLVWLIAPEIDDALASYTDFFLGHGCKLIGSSPESIRLASSKFGMFKHLQASNIETIDTRYLNESIPVSNDGWIVKPDDGAGAEGCYFFYDEDELNEFISKSDRDNYVIQPYISGNHMSMSLLIYEKEVVLLGCNQQFIEFEDKKVMLVAVGINECLDCYHSLLLVAKKIAHSVPGLAGYVGVDLIMNDNKVTVVEINPRLTTSYVGLSKSLGVNVADKILNTFLSGNLPELDVSAAQAVRIDL